MDVYGYRSGLLPFAKATGATTIAPPMITGVRTLSDRERHRLEFPHVVQIIHHVGDTLDIEMDAIEPIRVSAVFDPTMTWMEFEAGEPGHGLGG